MLGGTKSDDLASKSGPARLPRRKLRVASKVLLVYSDTSEYALITEFESLF